MKKILVPTDFSKNAENAFDYAIELSQNESVTIVLIHCFYVMYTSPEFPMELMVEQSNSIKINSDEQLKELSKKVLKYPSLKCEYLSIEGFIVVSIKDIIKKKKIDLVVMGTKGASGISEVLIGSNTAKIITKLDCPVIAVPEKAIYHGIKKVAYATNYLSSDITTLKKLVEFIKKFKSKVEIIHIADEECNKECEKEYMTKFSQKVEKKITYKAISYQLIFGDKIEEKLAQYMKKETIDMLAISTKHKNLFERIFTKGITKKLAYHTSIPLIVFHYKK